MLLVKSSILSTTEISLYWLNWASSFSKRISSFDMRRCQTATNCFPTFLVEIKSRKAAQWKQNTLQSLRWRFAWDVWVCRKYTKSLAVEFLLCNWQTWCIRTGSRSQTSSEIISNYHWSLGTASPVWIVLKQKNLNPVVCINHFLPTVTYLIPKHFPLLDCIDIKKRHEVEQMVGH